MDERDAPSGHTPDPGHQYPDYLAGRPISEAGPLDPPGHLTEMSASARSGRPIRYRPGPDDPAIDYGAAGEQTLELREEQLIAHKELRDLGEIEIRTELEDFPGRLEVDAYREEVEVEHVPVGLVVKERVDPWEEDGVLVVPVYEEQLVVVKRLLLREHLRVRRVGTTETRLFEETLQRERVVIDDPNQTGLVHEQYPTEDLETDALPDDRLAGHHQPPATRLNAPPEEGGFLGHLVRKAFPQ